MDRDTRAPSDSEVSIITLPVSGLMQARPSFSYARRPPHLFNFNYADDDVARWNLNTWATQEVICQPEAVYDLESIHLVSGKYIIIDRTLRLAETFRDSNLSAATRQSICDVAHRSTWVAHRCGGRLPLIIAKEGAANYGHTLTEILPKLVNLKRVRDEPLHLILPDEARPLISAYRLVIQSLALDLTIEFVEDGSALNLERAVWVGPVSHYPLAKSQALLDLSELLLDAAKVVRSEAGRQIYVDRPQGDKRRLSNADMVAAYMAEMGFTVVAPARLDLMSQIALFRDAEVIVGPLGAGLTNTIFASPSAAVGMIDPGLADMFYWDLASLKSQRFYWVFSDLVKNFELRRLLENYSVEPALIAPMIQAITKGGSRPLSAPTTALSTQRKARHGRLKSSLSPCFWGVEDQNVFFSRLQSLIGPFAEQGAFAGDNLLVFGRNLSMLEDEGFMQAFRSVILPENDVGYAIMWRLYIFCWAALQGLRRSGDFVECGVFTGSSSAIMVRYLDFASLDRKLFLFDTWGADRRVNASLYTTSAESVFEEVKQRFAPYPNVQLVRGFVPESFAQVKIDAISFLHIDLNDADAEVATLDHLFDRVAPGGIVLFDDYGADGFRRSKDAEDAWMVRRGYRIVEIPTGQGLVIK